METKYFFGINNEKVGPLDEKAIKQRIDQGGIKKDTLAWTNGMPDWQPVIDVPELKKAFGMLLSEQAVPPELPSANTAAAKTPPPLPAEGTPAGLSSLEAGCYKFAMWCYKPMGKWEPPLRKMVVKNPKAAVPVAFGTAAVMVFIVIFMMSNFSKPAQDQTAQNPQAGMQQVQQPGGDWRAQYNAIRDAQQFSTSVADDVYKYRRDSQDRMDETYRRANYDWYRSGDNN
ncbi:MAG: DUF4339 domain-containing protein [Candidatus Omnitrophica bacterium]|jgi:hypothetical protein|nr:DUF4339 domain-containing protein [Candidatus Omnitrophota bacterium]